MRHRAIGGFTLIEILISSAIAMLIAGMVTTAFLSMRKTINRAEARLAMHAQAQVIFESMQRSFMAMQQTCAVVALSQQGGGSPEAGQVDLLFMRAKESRNDYYQLGASYAQNQLTWEEWRWLRSTHTLYSSVNSVVSEKADNNYGDKMASRRRRLFTLATSFTPSGSGVDYNGKSFINQAKPRRWLDPATPLATLDDNLWFPGTHVVVAQQPPWTALTPRTWFPTLAPTSNDEGDYSDLQSNLSVECDMITDFTIELVPHDPAVAQTTVDDTATTSRVWQGVWLDGRLGLTLDPNGPVTTNAADPLGWNDANAALTFHKTDAAMRPRLIRVAFTITDPAKDMHQDFSFSFSVPALAPQP